MSFRFFISTIILTTLIMLSVLEKIKLPMISLPKGAQHKTIGELPIVEAVDDGDFFEKDGAEYIHRNINNDYSVDYVGYEGCIASLRNTTKDKKEIKRGIKRCKKFVEETEIYPQCFREGRPYSCSMIYFQ